MLKLIKLWLLLIVILGDLNGIESITINSGEEITLDGIEEINQVLLDKISGYKYVHVRRSDFDPSTLFASTKLDGISLHDCIIPSLHIMIRQSVRGIAFENVVARDGSGFRLLNDKNKSIPDLRVGIWDTKIDSVSDLSGVCQEYEVDISDRSLSLDEIIPLLKQIYAMGKINPNFSYKFVNKFDYPNLSDESGFFYTDKPKWWNGVDIAGYETLQVTDNKVRLRKEPSLKSPVLGLLNKGSRLLNKDSGPYETMLGYDKNSPTLEEGIRWVSVYSYELKTKGYISIEYIESMNGLFFP